MAEKEIISLLSGGMGNQMHQFAYGLYLSKKIKAKLYIDISFFSLNSRKLNVTPRDFILNEFGISNLINSIYSSRMLIRIVKNIRIIDFLVNRIFRVQYIFDRKQYVYPFSRKIILVNVFGSVYEYCQIEWELTKVFRQSNQNSTKAIESLKKLRLENKSIIVVHIRRTDYLNVNSVHYVLEKSYYDKAINYMRNIIPNPLFYFISDDLNWVCDNFDTESNSDFYLILDQNNNLLFDFCLIRNCDHVIASNSTFSWWGSFLNENKGKTVIVPKNWLKDDIDNLNDRYPNEWVIIE